MPNKRWPLFHVAICMVLAGCSLADTGAPMPGPLQLPVPDAASTPDLVQVHSVGVTLSKTLNLGDAPEMSHLRRAHAIAPTDWMFCLRGSTNEKPGPYAVFFKGKTAVHYRAAVRIDQCEQDRYEPVQNFAPKPPG